MKRFEYKATNDSILDVIRLNDLGKSGWELVSTVAIPTKGRDIAPEIIFLSVLKREITNKVR